jgi:DNA-directed RNA polymerase subunit RPC12/RpoP
VLIEARYRCGACGEEIVVEVDPSAGTEQEYVEDCPVCCRAHVLRVRVDARGEARVEAEPE